VTAAKRRQYGTGSIAQRSSDGRWIGTIEAGWTAKGTRRRVYVSAKTEAEAKRKLRDKQKAITKEGLPAAGTSSRTTLKQWADEWLPIQEDTTRPKSYATTASSVRKWIVPTIGHKRLEDLTPADVRAVDQAQRKAGNTTSSTRTHTVLMGMLKAALGEGHAVPPRILTMKAPARPVSDRDALTVEQAVKVLDVAASDPRGSRWVAALLQGMRQGECLGLTWDAVNLDAGLLDVSWQLQPLPYVDRKDKRLGFRVPRNYESRHLEGAWHLVRPKTARGQRLIPVVPWMAAALESWRSNAPDSPHGLVWPRDNGRPVDARDDSAAWKTLQQKAEIHHPSGRLYVLHEARNTTATLLLEAGVDPEIIKAILGHASIVTSRAYMRVNEAMTRAALEQVAARLQLGH